MLPVFLLATGWYLWSKWNSPSGIAQRFINLCYDSSSRKIEGFEKHIDFANGSKEIKEMWARLKEDASKGHERPSKEKIVVIGEEIDGNSALVFILYGPERISMSGKQTIVLVLKNEEWIITDILDGWGEFYQVMWNDYHDVISALRGIHRAETSFKSDISINLGYWVGDIAGLALILNNGKAINLIPKSIVGADYSPLPKHNIYKEEDTSVPYHGYYFRALEKDENDSPYWLDNKYYNNTKYGIIAFQEPYIMPTSGTNLKRIGGNAFIINQTGSIYTKKVDFDITYSGLPPELRYYPLPDPVSAGWRLCE